MLELMRSLFRRRHGEAELDDELRAYVDLLTAEKMRSGMCSSEARRAALIETGGIEQVKESCRDVRRMRWFEDFGKDLQYAATVLLRSPAFTVAVILTLSLGIGANTAAFSLINAILLKDLPVAAPQELVWFRNPSFSYPIFQEVQTRGKDVFDGLFAWTVESMNVEWDSDVQQAPALFVSGDFYATLGVSAASGRVFTGEDDNSPVAVISYDAWQRRFAADPGVIGKTIRIDRVPVTIVGVAPKGFFGVAPGLAPEATLPVALLPTLKPDDFNLKNPHQAWLHMMGRLKRGVSLDQANAAVQVWWPQVMETVTPQSMPPDRRARYLERRTELMPGHTGFSRVRGQFSEPLLLLLGLAGLLFLAACATTANLVLVRSSARRQEVAVRLAIGGTRTRLIRQFLAESSLLIAGGTICGLLFALWGGSVLTALITTKEDPIAVDLSPDGRVLAFTFALSLLTVVLAMLAPAMRSAAGDPREGLKESLRTAGRSPGASRFGRLLVVSQVALAVLMVAGAALFARSLRQLVSLDPGFDHRGILLIGINPLLAGYRDARLSTFHTTLEERIRATPGVESVALSWVPPISNEMGYWTQYIGVDGRPPERTERNSTFFNVVSPGYFATIGQRLLGGRDFSPGDGASDRRVCIISESVARRFFPDRDPLGRRITIGKDPAREDMEIVGIAEDARYQHLRESSTPTVYLFHLQQPEFLNGNNLIAEARTRVPPASVVEPIRRELRALDPNVLIRFETLSNRIRESLVTERALALISGFLGVVALLLAATGLYGLLAYTVSRRTGEIGIRIALGSPQRTVQWLVLRDCLLLSVAGIAAGLGAAFALGGFAESLLYGMTSSDPAALGFTCALIFVVALVSAWIPARRAARVDPMVALRHE